VGERGIEPLTLDNIGAENEVIMKKHNEAVIFFILF